ncbi:unnamed protein product [Rhodiola kirilowii]
MGNHHASGQYSSSCKVILSDGTVEQFHEPLTVAELMLEYPQQVVVEVYTNSKRPAPLPADMVLEMKTVYVMVPVRRGRPIHADLSTDEAQKILFRANAMLRTNYSSSLPFTGIIPFIAGRMCSCSAGVKADKAMLMDKLRSDRAEFSKVEFSMELVDEILPQFFIRRELSGKGWKPTLDTIKEKIVEQTVYKR